jgi:hypothetical protein
MIHKLPSVSKGESFGKVVRADGEGAGGDRKKRRMAHPFKDQNRKG